MQKKKKKEWLNIGKLIIVTYHRNNVKEKTQTHSADSGQEG